MYLYGKSLSSPRPALIQYMCISVTYTRRILSIVSNLILSICQVDATQELYFQHLRGWHRPSTPYVLLLSCKPLAQSAQLASSIDAICSALVMQAHSRLTSLLFASHKSVLSLLSAFPLVRLQVYAVNVQQWCCILNVPLTLIQ